MRNVFKLGIDAMIASICGMLLRGRLKVHWHSKARSAERLWRRSEARAFFLLRHLQARFPRLLLSDLIFTIQRKSSENTFGLETTQSTRIPSGSALFALFVCWTRSAPPLESLQDKPVIRRPNLRNLWTIRRTPSPSRLAKMTQDTSRSQSAVRRFWKANFSPSFFYPIKGIYYFASHRYLHPLAKSRLLPLALLSGCVLTVLFLTAYLPIVAVMEIFHHSGSAWVNGTVFILGIGTLIVTVLFEALFVDHTQVDIFDAVMVAEGYENLVRERRTVSEDIDESDPLKRLGPREKGAEFAPFSIRQIVEFIVLLPLNFVPFAGVPLFLLATGYRTGPLIHRRYFDLKGLTRKERNDFIKVKGHRWSFTWFGTIYMVLQLVPILSLLFLLTSAAGSALWSVHIERERTDQLPLEDDDLPPEYTDEP